MTRSVHPDDLDRLTSARAPRPATAPASAAEVATALQRVLASGRLLRIPRNPRHRDIVLAIVSRALRRRHPYTEPALNECLTAALDALHATVDHVTCRRSLVDHGFVKRDRAGTRYFLNYPKYEATLAADAMQAIEALIGSSLRGRGAG